MTDRYQRSRRLREIAQDLRRMDLEALPRDLRDAADSVEKIERRVLDLEAELETDLERSASRLAALETNTPAPAPSKRLRRVILESPYAGDVRVNVAYAKSCVRDSVKRGEAPIASHLLFTQPDILDNNDPDQLRLGVAAGLAWLDVADAMVVYTDLGISKGMIAAMEAAGLAGLPIDQRQLV